VDLFHVRRGDHQPQAHVLSGTLLALRRHCVRDLEAALPGAAKGIGALTAGRPDGFPYLESTALPSMIGRFSLEIIGDCKWPASTPIRARC